MAVRTQWEDKGVLWKFTGIVNADDLFNSNRDVYGDSRFDTIHYQILDLLDVTAVDIGAPDIAVKKIQQVAAYDRAAAKTNPTMKVATVAHDDTLALLANLYEAEMTESPWESNVFNNLAEARAWLDNS